MKRLNRVRALFGFLRLNRHVIFDAAFQEKLDGMYRQTGAGGEPHPPAMMCMVLLLQGYVGASDAEAVELSVMDLRWQMVLDCLGASEPLFSQGALQAFRERMVAHEMDRELLERTVALVRDGVVSKVEGQALTKAVRVAIDSRPLVGAGRVEDTINLLGHAARRIVQLVAKILDCDAAHVCRKAGIPLPERRISIEDAEMRHGRKSRSKRFDGYKEHIARDLDVPAIMACAVTPANRPEEDGARPIADDIEHQGFTLHEAHVDRAYVNSPVMGEVVERGGAVFAKPWALRPARLGLFSKADFRIDLRTMTITCPAGEVESFEPGGDTVHFDPEVCGACPLRANCTQAASGTGRTVSIAADEARQKSFRKLQTTVSGRATLRARVAVEHSLAHIAARKGPKARYLGVRKNLFDLRRASAIQNLEALHRLHREAA